MTSNSARYMPGFYVNSGDILAKKVIRFTPQQVQALDEYYAQHLHDKQWPKEGSAHSMEISKLATLNEKQVKIYCRNKKSRDLAKKREKYDMLREFFKSKNEEVIPSTPSELKEQVFEEKQECQGHNLCSTTMSETLQDFIPENGLSPQDALEAAVEPMEIEEEKFKEVSGGDSDVENDKSKELDPQKLTKFLADIEEDEKKLEKILEMNLPFLMMKPRFKWDYDLNVMFKEAIKQLEQKTTITPFRILNYMKTNSSKLPECSRTALLKLTRQHVASHLQKFRVKEKGNMLIQSIGSKPTIASEILMNNSAFMRRPTMPTPTMPTEYINPSLVNQTEMKSEPKSPTAEKRHQAFAIPESLRPQMGMQYKQLPNIQIPATPISSINAQLLNFQAKQEAERQQMMSLLIASGAIGNQFNPQLTIRQNQNQSFDAAQLNLLQAHQAQVLLLQQQQQQQRMQANALLMQDGNIVQSQFGQQPQISGINRGNFQRPIMTMHPNAQASSSNPNNFMLYLQEANKAQSGSMFSHIMNPSTLKAFAEHNRTSGITSSAGSAFERNLKKEIKPFSSNGAQQKLI